MQRLFLLLVTVSLSSWPSVAAPTATPTEVAISSPTTVHASTVHLTPEQPPRKPTRWWMTTVRLIRNALRGAVPF